MVNVGLLFRRNHVADWDGPDSMATIGSRFTVPDGNMVLWNIKPATIDYDSGTFTHSYDLAG
jgi:hypothetical protein